MRLRLMSFAAAVAAAVWLGYFLWPQQEVPLPSPAPSPSPEQPHTDSEAPLPPPVREADRTGQEQGAFINGITTDTTGVPLEGTDILHRVLAIGPDQHCHDLREIELELDSATELLTSDAQGYFLLPFQSDTAADKSRHCLIISAHKQGYLATTVSLSLEMNDPPRLIEVELSPNRSISGSVVGPSNRPVDDAEVIAWQDQPDEAAEQACVNKEPMATTDTQANGEFTLHVGDDAGYCIQAFHPAWSRSQAHRVTGAERTAPRLQLGHRAQVSGTVVDLQGTPLPDLDLALVARNPDGNREQALTRSDSSGNFVFDRLDYARYQFTSTSPNYRVAEPQELVITDAQPEQEVTVKVFPVTLISGRILDAHGEALAQAEVTAYSPYDKSATLAQANSNEQGEFTLPSLHRSHIAYESFQMATSMLDAASANEPFTGEACLDFFHPRHGKRTLSLAVTESSLDLGTVQLQEPAIQIEGRVLNHRDQVLAATLVLTPGEAQASKDLEVRMPRCEDFTLSRDISTDAKGQFSFGLPQAGPYKVEVRTDRYKPRTFDFDFRTSNRDLEIKLD